MPELIICPHCGETLQLLARGTIPVHAVSDVPFKYCPGSGQLPRLDGAHAASDYDDPREEEVE